MGRYEKMFKKLETQGRGAFVPFVVIGDPAADDSLAIIQALVESGADALELGIPFSDPIADGPVIQASAVRALGAGATPEKCFNTIAKIRGRYPETPIGLLVYANLVVANGQENFYTLAAESKVDSVLIADVPVFEAEPFVASATEQGIHQIFIAPPNADDALLKRVAELTKGYTYVVARSGVTGTGEHLRDQGDIFAKLKSFGSPPCLLGFGISKPEHVRAAIKAGAAGAISGSAIVRIIEENKDDFKTLLTKLSKFATAMKSATVRL
jgi:tryptophan synthase alpha chain